MPELVSNDDSDIIAANKKIEYCLNVILKEAKLEDVLVKQLFYTMLSMYTNDPRNLGIQSPTGEGKNYVIKKVADLFPKEDVIKYVGMTDKSIFHRNGKLVIKNDSGEYEFIDDALEKLDEDIESKQNELSNTKDRNTRQGLKAIIKDLLGEKKRLLTDAKKLIDLSHKCIIFLDTPRPELLNAIMSLTSHDEYEVEYEFVDTNNGIKTRTNVLRGWPVVIFAQAIDYSHHKRYSEIQRRFPTTNPRMDEEKYKAAVELIAYKRSVPDFLYQKMVVSNEQKERAREIIKGLKEKIMDMSTAATSPGNNNVFTPFESAITKSLATKRSSDMTAADRMLGYLTLLAQVNVEDRPCIIFRKKGHVITQRIPLATFSDLQEAMFLMEYSNGVRPYVIQWYQEVFLPTYNQKQEPDSKPSPDGERTLKESRIAVTTQQLADSTFEKKGKRISPRHIRETYLEQLANQGYIDSVSSELDKRSDIYFPVIVTSTNAEKIGDTPNTYNFAQSPIFAPQNEIRSRIQALLEYNDENTIVEIEKNNGLDALIDRYYSQNGNGKGNEKNNLSVRPISISYLNGAQTEPDSANEDQKWEIDEKCMYSPISNRLYDFAINRKVIQQPCGGEISLHPPNNYKFSCNYCNFQADSRKDYDHHSVTRHPNRQGYPDKNGRTR